jgi:hypothetical protein
MCSSGRGSQFRRFYNLYFLLAAIISLLPFGLAPISPVTSVFPLVLVLVVTMIKDGYEDLVRPARVAVCASTVSCSPLSDAIEECLSETVSRRSRGQQQQVCGGQAGPARGDAEQGPAARRCGPSAIVLLCGSPTCADA